MQSEEKRRQIHLLSNKAYDLERKMIQLIKEAEEICKQIEELKKNDK
jgi:hypothetical protein